MGGASDKRRRLSASGRIAAPALELPLYVIQPAAQPFDGPCDVSDIVTGDGSFLISGHGWRAGLASRVWAVGRAIPLVAEAEGVTKLEVNASAVRIPPDGGGFLGEGRSEAEDAAEEDRGSHRPNMTRGPAPVECSNGFV
jgi:hypothetical protein